MLTQLSSLNFKYKHQHERCTVCGCLNCFQNAWLFDNMQVVKFFCTVISVSALSLHEHSTHSITMMSRFDAGRVEMLTSVIHFSCFIQYIIVPII